MEKIIKKKLLLIVSMLAVTFALAGCSSSDKKVEFDYDGNTLVQIAETQATNYMQIAQVEDVYNFYVDEEANGGQVDETTADALKVFSTIESDYGKFQQFKPVNLEDEDDKTIQEVDDKVVVTLYAECAEKEAIVKATFVDNSVTYNFQKYSVMAQNKYSEEEADQMLASNGVYPYKISEFEVAANQTLKDKMKDACGKPLHGRSVSREKFQAPVFQGNGNAGADILSRPVADQGAEHHDVFFHKEARGLHTDHEVLRGQEFRGSLPNLQSGGDDPG